MDKMIKNIQDMLQERYDIALRTDEEMGNKGGVCFLSNNPDYIYYRACIDMLNCLGMSAEVTTRDGKTTHIVY